MTLEFFQTTPIQLCVCDANWQFQPLYNFIIQSSVFLVAVAVPILGLPFLLSAVITGSMKIHPREVLLTHNSL